VAHKGGFTTARASGAYRSAARHARRAAFCLDPAGGGLDQQKRPRRKAAGALFRSGRYLSTLFNGENSERRPPLRGLSQISAWREPTDSKGIGLCFCGRSFSKPRQSRRVVNGEMFPRTAKLCLALRIGGHGRVLLRSPRRTATSAQPRKAHQRLSAPSQVGMCLRPSCIDATFNPGGDRGDRLASQRLAPPRHSDVL
jgi:hypothetical protein